MKLSSVYGAVCGFAAATSAQLVDTKPFEATGFQMMPFNASQHQQGVAAGESPFSHASTNAVAASKCPTRVEWHRLSDANRRQFVGAIKCLFNRPSHGGYPGSKNRWEDLVSVHQRLTPKVHMVPAFLPWHRYYVAIFESMIRSECGYTGPMTWWDETLDAGKFHSALVFQDAYFSPAPLKNSKGQGACVTTGTFGGVQLHLGPGAGYSTHCLSRAVDESLTAQCNSAFVNYCNSMTTYAKMEPCIEMGPHAYGHNGVGSVMSDVYPSPSDPIFFMHHGFIDRAWYRWQNANPSARMYQLSGGLSLDAVLTSLGLRGDVRVRDMMDTRGGFLCYEYDY